MLWREVNKSAHFIGIDMASNILLSRQFLSMKVHLTAEHQFEERLGLSQVSVLFGSVFSCVEDGRHFLNQGQKCDVDNLLQIFPTSSTLT